jgi:hypothetical protein
MGHFLFKRLSGEVKGDSQLFADQGHVNGFLPSGEK